MCNMLQYEKAIRLYHSRGVANSTKIALMHQQIIRTNKMICFFLGVDEAGTYLTNVHYAWQRGQLNEES